MLVASFTLLLLFAVLLVVLVMFAYFLSTDYTIEEAVLVNAELNEIFPLVNVLENWQEWSVWNENNGLDIDYAGPTSGASATLHWKSPQIQATLEIVAIKIPSQIEFTLSIEDGKFSSKGIIVLDKTMPLVTQVAWRLELTIAQTLNPVHRYQAYFLRKYLENSIKESLNGLVSTFEEAQS